MQLTTSLPNKKNSYGIIVVDTCALWDLSVQLPAGFNTGENREPKRLVDALIYLSNHGFEVIIPEMVAYESGGFIRDGRSDGDYFTINRLHGHSLVSEPMGQILEAQHHGANTIVPLPAKSQSDEAVFLNGINKIIDGNGNDKFKRHELLNWYKEYNPGKHAGERAACQTINALPKELHSTIFFLSHDQEAQKLIAEQCKNHEINLLGVVGFYNALLKNDMLKNIGLSNVPSQDVADSIENYSTSQRKTSDIKSIFAQFDKSSGKEIIAPHESPFFTNLQKQLTDDKDLQNAVPVNIAPGKPVVQVHSVDQDYFKKLQNLQSKYRK